MEMRAKAKVPLLIGTAGTCGTKTSVEWMLKITKEIAKENKEKLKIVTLKTDLSNEFVLEKYKSGKIKPLEGAPKINENIINNCNNIVALAGVEQIQKAINTNADIIISGRSTDTAIIAESTLSFLGVGVPPTTPSLGTLIRLGNDLSLIHI